MLRVVAYADRLFQRYVTQIYVNADVKINCNISSTGVVLRYPFTFMYMYAVFVISNVQADLPYNINFGCWGMQFSREQ